MKKSIVIFFSIMTLISCKQNATNPNTAETPDNPFFTEWDTPFQIPPFEKIKNEHYLPAIKEGIKKQEEEIMAITSSTETPTFENTILPLDKSGEFLNKVTSVFYPLNGAHTSKEMQELAQQISPMLSKHKDNIALNAELFDRLKTVYENKENSGLTASQLRALEIHYRNFVRSGANLNDTAKARLRELNEQITSLTLKFGQNLLAETNSSFKLVIDNKADLAGLPEPVIAGAKEAAENDSLEGKWLFTLHKPSLIPFLKYAENRELREKIYAGYFMRGNNNNKFDNKEVLQQITNLRAERANLFGFKNHAEYVIDINMAKTPENVYAFLHQLWEPALNIAKKEVNEMQAIIDAEGGNFKLASWDWWYYAEKLRKQKYDLDESQLKPYFKLENVRDGMFDVANKLYGITLTKIENAPKYHEEVEAFEVKEANGDHIGVLYLDYHPRESKRGGAWCTNFRSAKYDMEGNKIKPVQSIVCNFTKPTAELPSLLTWDEVTTLFHEFGHALHFLFVDGKYNVTAGLCSRDYVELPSQIMENFAAEPEVLKKYGKHYETGETIPDELIEKIQNSSHFNQGFATVEYLAASLLDMDYHTLSKGEPVSNPLAFEKKSMENIGLITEIIPRYRSTYFAHIFSGGYSAGYYVYIWAAVLDADAFNAFKESGNIYNQELASKFRKYCLSECGEDEGMVQYMKFRGQEPSIEPLLKRRGLK